jgi:cytidylate kinase
MGEGFRLNMQIASAQFDTIRMLADKGNCIFVGRCADYVLRNRKDLVSVFVMANKDFRVKTLMERKGIDADQARKLMRQVDKDRSSYYKYYTDQIWGEAENYELCIDSSKIGVDGAVEVIKAFVAAKEKVQA